MYDVIVIGAGPAGLQAALTLGRMHRRALVLDSGVYRNDPAAAMHNFLTRDGTDPAALRADALREIARYESVDVRGVAATRVTGSVGDFTVEVTDGRRERAARIILATGVRDLLPEIPGLTDVFGSVAAHCPFCHGHEYADGLVVIQASDHAAGVALMMKPIASETLILDDIASVRAGGDGIILSCADGSEVDARGFFVASTFVQAAPFADQLGLDLLPSGCISIDAFGRTSEPGVYAAGDLAHSPEFPMPMASVLNAAAAGLLAAAGCVREGMLAELAG